MTRHRLAPALAAVPLLLLGACSGGPAGTSGGTSTPASSPAGSGTSDTSGAATSSSRPAGSSATRRTGEDGSTCVAGVREAMTPHEQARQLLMVALTPEMGRSGLDPEIADGLGGMLYLGGWAGRSSVAATSAHLQEQVPTVGGARVGLLVAADQEGGEVQQLTGEGFSAIPAGRELGALPTAERDRYLDTLARELEQAGVNVNLAPVADTVPADIGAGNGPIGAFGRELGSTPAAVSRGATAFARAMDDADVVPTVKHFPGIGRIRGNTDATAEGITDTVASADDPHLDPFRDAIAAAPGLVMVSSARYPELDAEQQATFSRPIITGLLREDLGFDGVVVTDDIGVAEAVADVPLGERATRFVAAGGDVVLTADASQTDALTEAIVVEAAADAPFAARVEESVTRVLTLKEEMGLLRCG